MLGVRFSKRCLTAMGRGCVKTLDTLKFWGTQTIAEVPMVDPSPFYEVDLFVHLSIRTFSHNLDPQRSFAEC
jgi:hypothetical protein